MNIDLLGKIKDIGLYVEEELGRLKDMEKEYESVFELGVVPDWSLSDFNLPQISGLRDHVSPSIADEEASSCSLCCLFFFLSLDLQVEHDYFLIL